MLRSITVGIFLALYILIAGPLFVLHAWLAGDVRRLYAMGVGGARFALRMAGVRVKVEGVENIPAGVCVFVANHVSNVDPPAVVCSIPRRVALLAKKEVFRIPVLATALRLADFVEVDRADREAAMASVDEGVERMKRGVSYLIFAEGTRSPDARLRAFKKGTFVMAMRAGAPVVPVAVAGTQRVMPRGSSRICPGEVTVRFGTAIETAGLSVDDRDALRERVEAAVNEMLPPEQRRA